MDESAPFLESGGSKERLFVNEVDLCPLELMLIGGSIRFPGEEGESSKEALKKDKHRSLREDPDFLLRPFGLTTGKSSDIREIREIRQRIKTLNAGYLCFGNVNKDYEFYYDLNEPDKEGRIPNEFKFRFRETGSEDFWDKNNPQDVESFRKITLSPGSSTYAEGKPFFILTKDEDKGILTLTFAPLLENTKQ